MNDLQPGYVAVGRVLSPWGARGDVKVEPLAEPPGPFLPGRTVTVAGQPRTVENVRRSGRLLYVKLSGIDDRPAAAALRGLYIQVPESDLDPPGEDRYYHFQLVGLSVRSTTGEPLGRVASVLPTPSNDVLVVQGPLGELLIPAVADIVSQIDLQEGVITIEVVPGLLPPRPKQQRHGPP